MQFSNFNRKEDEQTYESVELNRYNYELLKSNKIIKKHLTELKEKLMDLQSHKNLMRNPQFKNKIQKQNSYLKNQLKKKLDVMALENAKMS